MRRTAVAVLVLLSPFANVRAQDNPLAGVIDIHVHAAPDSTPRSIDAIDLARLAQARGMRGIVLKNHFAPTADMAYLVHKVVPGLTVYGGVDLNLSVGGLNPAAVEKMAQTTGQLGRVVWMATADTCVAIAPRPCVAVSHGGELVPAAKDVISMIAKYKLVMATGHNSAADALLLLREAQRQGVTHMVVTHAVLPPISMSIPQMQQAASMGAYIEFVYNGLLGAAPQFNFNSYAQAIRAVGPSHCILSSDMGQPDHPLHPDALVALFTGLELNGITRAEIIEMSRTNPARLLGLE